MASRNIEWQRDVDAFVDFLERAARIQAARLSPSDRLESGGVGYIVARRSGRRANSRTAEARMR
jgi:hypothetical protein